MPLSEGLKQYQKLTAKSPGFNDEELTSFSSRKRKTNQCGGETNTAPANHSEFIEHPDIDFTDVGGMERVKREIDLKIIKPLGNAEIYKAYGKKAGGGILLYGPPGCGEKPI